MKWQMQCEKNDNEIADGRVPDRGDDEISDTRRMIMELQISVKKRER